MRFVSQELNVEVHLCNPRIWETEAEGSRLKGHSGLHSKTLSPKEESILLRYCSTGSFVPPPSDQHSHAPFLKDTAQACILPRDQDRLS